MGKLMDCRSCAARSVTPKTPIPYYRTIQKCSLRMMPQPKMIVCDVCKRSRTSACVCVCVRETTNTLTRYYVRDQRKQTLPSCKVTNFFEIETYGKQYTISRKMANWYGNEPNMLSLAYAPVYTRTTKFILAQVYT